ncbi:MAG: metallophosphoesterase family protein [Candidatus Velthaea sp.]
MTVVGLVSDTHLPHFGRALPRELERGLRQAGVARILHMGDMTEMLAVGLFERIAPFDGVAGNNDGADLRERFGRKKIVKVEGVRIGLVHGDGKLGNALNNATAAFVPESVDVVCFGHSHRPMIERYENGVTFVNPGSPTDKRVNPRYSYAIMQIDGSALDVQLHYYTDRNTG